MLAGYLQAGESTIMKHANVIWQDQLKKERIPFWQVNFVHDEWQTETINDMATALYIAQVQADAIKTAGENLNLKCPILGTFDDGKTKSIGLNWYETH